MHTFTKLTFLEWIRHSPLPPYHENTQVVIIIPALAEEHIVETIDSLTQNADPECHVECLIMINESESALESVRRVNEISFEKAQNALVNNELTWIDFHIVYCYEIPHKDYGVGFVRKLLMDEAARRFHGSNTGMIASLDGDCRVSRNYCTELAKLQHARLKKELFVIHFEHRIDESTYPDIICDYEIHLRYFINMQAWLRLPYAFQTIGSSFCVRSDSYLQIGGMNKRKAGEDFYFIHKFSKKGTCDRLARCTVFPSGRISDRVPFGTGKAVGDASRRSAKILTYNPASFRQLSVFIGQLKEIWSEPMVQTLIEKCPMLVREYFGNEKHITSIERLKQNTRSYETFEKAFFQWFDAFKLMKFLHFARTYFEDIPVMEAVEETVEELGIKFTNESRFEVLDALRHQDKEVVNARQV